MSAAAKIFWHSVVDGFCAPFNIMRIIGCGSPLFHDTKEKQNTASSAPASPENLDKYISDSYAFFINSVHAADLVLPYQADVMTESKQKSRAFFIASAIEGMRKFQQVF